MGCAWLPTLRPAPLNLHTEVTGQTALLRDVSYFYSPKHFMDDRQARNAHRRREIAAERERPSQPMGFMISPLTGALQPVS